MTHRRNWLGRKVIHVRPYVRVRVGKRELVRRHMRRRSYQLKLPFHD